MILNAVHAISVAAAILDHVFIIYCNKDFYLNSHVLSKVSYTGKHLRICESSFYVEAGHLDTKYTLATRKGND